MKLVCRQYFKSLRVSYNITHCSKQHIAVVLSETNYTCIVIENKFSRVSIFKKQHVQTVCFIRVSGK